MAKAHSKSQPTTDKAIKTERYYTVGYVPQKANRETPKINLCGNWLKDAGFTTGATVIVKITEGYIVLIPDSNEVTQLKQQLKQIQSALQAS